MRSAIEYHLNQAWYHQKKWIWCLFPLMLLFWMLTTLRKYLYHLNWLKSEHPGIPVIIVGNMSVGGTGKTPVVIALASFLQQNGLKVGILSRGYGGTNKEYPAQVFKDSKAEIMGDEPCLIALNVESVVLVDPDRVRGAKALKNLACEIIICDDGLQHYALERDIELVVVDQVRGFGNQQLLPVGPLREPVSRLKTIDFLLVNGGPSSEFEGISFKLEADHLIELKSGDEIALEWLKNRHVYGAAGIGHPARFFNTLKGLGAKVDELSFPDHYQFSEDDIPQNGQIVIVTEKDAVKLSDLKLENCYYLTVKAKIPDSFFIELNRLLTL